MDFTSPTESWAYQRSHYAALEHSPFRRPWVSALRDLVDGVVASPFAGEFFASRSHDNLVISPAAGYRERFDCPRIIVVPQPDDLLYYRITAPGRYDVSHVPYAEAWPALVTAIGWLRSAAT